MDLFDKRQKTHGFVGVAHEELVHLTTVGADVSQSSIADAGLSERGQQAAALVAHISFELIGELPMFAFGNEMLREAIVTKLRLGTPNEQALLANYFGNGEDAIINLIEGTLRRLHYEGLEKFDEAG